MRGIKFFFDWVTGRFRSKKTIQSPFHLVGENPALAIIHPRVYTGGNVKIFCNAKVEIGEDTMIADGVTIHTATHDYLDHPMWAKRIDAPVRIGKHVWIGTNATILPGVIIGDYSVIGAGAVIAKNVPVGAIVIGNPARIIKYRQDIGNSENWKKMIELPQEALIVKETFKKEYYE